MPGPTNWGQAGRCETAPTQLAGGQDQRWQCPRSPYSPEARNEPKGAAAARHSCCSMKDQQSPKQDSKRDRESKLLITMRRKTDRARERGTAKLMG